LKIDAMLFIRDLCPGTAPLEIISGSASLKDHVHM
jgi:hypothetical protein